MNAQIWKDGRMILLCGPSRRRVAEMAAEYGDGWTIRWL